MPSPPEALASTAPYANARLLDEEAQQPVEPSGSPRATRAKYATAVFGTLLLAALCVGALGASGARARDATPAADLPVLRWEEWKPFKPFEPFKPFKPFKPMDQIVVVRDHDDGSLNVRCVGYASRYGTEGFDYTLSEGSKTVQIQATGHGHASQSSAKLPQAVSSPSEVEVGTMGDDIVIHIPASALGE